MMKDVEYTMLADEKGISEHDQSHTSSVQNPTVRARLLNRFIPAFLLTLAVSLLFRSVFVCNHHYNPCKGLLDPEDAMDEDDWLLVDSNVTKVPLEAHIMSKCPDARDCLRQLILPTMQRIGDKVDFKLSYIGSFDPESDDVYCMHGPTECLGNIIQLCAAKVYPDPKMYLGFANCMTSKYRDIPQRELVEGCALEHGLDFQKVNSCISDEGEGTKLLRESIERSKEAHVTKSCTVRLDGKVRCVRDGGKWYDCPGGSEVVDLVGDVEKLFNEMNSA